MGPKSRTRVPGRTCSIASIRLEMGDDDGDGNGDSDGDGQMRHREVDMKECE